MLFHPPHSCKALRRGNIFQPRGRPARWVQGAVQLTENALLHRVEATTALFASAPILPFPAVARPSRVTSDYHISMTSIPIHSSPNSSILCMFASLHGPTDTHILSLAIGTRIRRSDRHPGLRSCSSVCNHRKEDVLSLRIDYLLICSIGRASSCPLYTCLIVRQIVQIHPPCNSTWYQLRGASTSRTTHCKMNGTRPDTACYLDESLHTDMWR